MHTLEILLVYDNGKECLIPFSDILYLEAEGKTTRIYYLKHSDPCEICEVLSYKNLGYYAELPALNILVQTHRSFLVNLYQVEHIKGNQVVFKHPVEPTIRLTENFKKDFYNRLPH